MHQAGRPIIFLDMDGVLVDFMMPALRLIDLDPDSPGTRQKLATGMEGEYTQSIIKEIRDRVAGAGIDFWTTLQKLPWADVLVGTLNQYDVTVALLSSPLMYVDAPGGKMIWLRENFPHLNFVFTAHKELLARPGTLLVDDVKSNVVTFQRCGGEGMVWPSQFADFKAGELIEELTLRARRLQRP